MKTDHLTFKQKDLLMKHIFSKYNKAKIELATTENNYNYYPSSSILKVGESKNSNGYESRLLRNLDHENKLNLYIYKIDHINKHISKKSLLIITKDYIENVDHIWYLDYFSKSTYYRMKHRAFNEFLELFDENML